MKFLWATLVLTISTAAVFAGHEVVAPGKETKGVVETSPFDAGRHEFQLGVGYNWAINSDTAKRPNIEDLDVYARFGWMLTSPQGDGFFRGNLEFLLEAFGGGVTSGPGDMLVGGSFLLRYNFVQPNAKWVPYFQIGGGGLYNDIYKEHPQGLIGQAFEFNLQGAFGLRYLFNDHMAAYVEAGYRHISNAGMADRNLGLNSVTAQGGVSWLW